ncbi:MAG: hypothetical protein KGQ46_02125 [Hyphomicrobiales bacterium]|nr:hypothetical protein [Hyphomicrobiales bacterium]MDE2115900.1 hypothetical protein [Hyphomicrobiales bacterium]
MFIDTSAFVALMAGEPDAGTYFTGTGSSTRANELGMRAMQERARTGRI